MSESVQQGLPIDPPDDRLEVSLSEEQNLVLRTAAALVGWTVEQYVLAAALDRAERDLCENAALQRENARRRPVRGVDDEASPGKPSNEGHALVEPFVAVVTAIG